jgi:hypothetical protein
MTRRPKQEKAPLRPVVTLAVLSPREQQAWRRLSEQQGTNRQFKNDPLELRLGLRALYRSNRPHYATSNPGYDELLTRNPDLDASLPGLAWLHVVYRRDFKLVTLPSARAEIAARFEQFEREQALPRRAEQPQEVSSQTALF